MSVTIGGTPFEWKFRGPEVRQTSSAAEVCELAELSS